jgi:uncharacterized protein (TIGR03492 family)
VTRVLFVSNGHGEAAIADCIARNVQKRLPAAELDHLALVGDARFTHLHEVGPRRRMPSGGLVAMANVRNLFRDVRAGLFASIAAQLRFLRNARGRYDVAVAVGDVYALVMTLRARAPVIFVGTAKSISVAPYGRFERRMLARAALRFVRDEATAQALRDAGLSAEAGNVIVDLFAGEDDPIATSATRDFMPLIAMLPGSRANAYADATFLLSVLRALLPRYPRLGAVLSVARDLDASRFAHDARRNGWDVRPAQSPLPFTLALEERTAVSAWSGALAPIFSRATIVMGQAGTANEGAAAQGVPVIAFAAERWGASRWYRRRQQGLLGSALVVAPRRLPEAVTAVAQLLDDPARRQSMSDTGRARMGAQGAAARIAGAIARIVEERACVA